jgi:hypothetical protein
VEPSPHFRSGPGETPARDEQPSGTPLRERPDAPLGTLIFRAGLLPAETIESALEEGVRTGKRLGDVLTDRGLLQEADLARLLAGQKGLEFVSLREQAVDPAAVALLTEEQARLFRALPFGFQDRAPVVAIADPNDEILTRNVREALGSREVVYAVATPHDLDEAIVAAYERSREAAPELLHAAGKRPGDDLLREPTAAPPAVEPSVETGASGPLPLRPAQSQPAPEPALPPVAPAPEPVPEPPPAPLPPAAAEPSPVAAEPASPRASSGAYHVGIRLTTGERVEAGAFPSLVTAKEQARTIMLQLASADESAWPFVSGRFLKPDTIVSVDIAEPTAGATAL